MKNVVSAAVFGLAFISGSALAHGAAQARHGGIVQTANDISFELVPRASGAALHLSDHDKPVDASKLSGRLMVLNGGQKSEAPLKPAGADKLEANGIAVAPGSKVVAAIDGLARQTVTVRFSVK